MCEWKEGEWESSEKRRTPDLLLEQIKSRWVHGISMPSDDQGSHGSAPWYHKGRQEKLRWFTGTGLLCFQIWLFSLAFHISSDCS